MEDQKSSDQNTDQPTDPWKELSPEQKKRAERHLYILYAVMISFALLPFILFFILRRS